MDKAPRTPKATAKIAGKVLASRGVDPVLKSLAAGKLARRAAGKKR